MVAKEFENLLKERSRMSLGYFTLNIHMRLLDHTEEECLRCTKTAFRRGFKAPPILSNQRAQVMQPSGKGQGLRKVARNFI